MIETTILWLALTIYHEARGEPPAAQVAVAQVVLNRAEADRTTVKRVVHKRGQFRWRKNKRVEAATFLACRDNAVKALHQPDVTGGATHFHSGARPYWAKKMKKTGRYGRIHFYRGRD